MAFLSIVTTCTNRKRATPTRSLLARSLPKGSTISLAKDWGARIKIARPVMPASELYQGRAFREACNLAKESGGGLFILSAGLGVIDGVKPIPSYSLTVSETSEDAIQARCIDKDFSPDHWWASLTGQLGSANPISELIKKSRNRRWLFALSKGYLDLIIADLDQLTEHQLERVRIVGPQISRLNHRVLNACLLEVDGRLNGPDSPIAGTQGDFAQRAARFVYDEVISGNPDGVITEHRRAVAKRVSGWRLAKRFNRQSMSDENIKKKIKALWKAAEGKSGRMLRLLRDQEQIACEQSRFQGLFKQVQESAHL